MYAAGDMLGRYELLAPIGAGGMGEVWKARDTRLGRIVAIKWLKSEHAARFRQEAHAIAALNHPHICQLYDVGDNYLVLEYVEGVPIAGPLDPVEAVQSGLQIASALQAAHAKKIIHRDLKPDNILRTASGVKVLDFGLSKLLEAPEDSGTAPATRTAEGTIAGTLAYMSPEQARGEMLDERTDIFSLGAVLYELLGGTRAFRGRSTAETLSAVLRDEPAPQAGPSDLVQIIRRCLRKERGDRFASMAEVKAALEAAAKSAGPTSTAPSLAVLPFANMSRDPDDEYFSDGLTEDIINALVKIPGLKVIARTSAFAFKGHNTDIRRIAETLGVTTVMEGSVRRAGNRVRVTAQLITAADGSHLWSERYDRDVADIFAVQDEISAAIVQALRSKLAPQPTGRARYNPGLPAHEALLKARYFHWQVSAESMEQAGKFYEQAVALDPRYALAHALYADYLFGRTTVGLSPLRDIAHASRTLAHRALELDSESPEANGVLCVLAATHDYDWLEAGRRFAAVMTAETVAPHQRMGCAWTYLLGSGRRKEALAQLELAVQDDPLHLTNRAIKALCLGAVGRDGEAEELLRQSIDLDSRFFWSYYFLADLYAARRMFSEALPFAEKAYSLSPWYAPSVGIYGGLLARKGELDRSRHVVRPLGAGEAYGASKGLAIFETCRGDIDRAAGWYRKAIEERDAMVVAFLQGAIGDELRASSHWPNLAAMMRFTHRGACEVGG